ncbi:MAG: DUF4344 domain-containing metallopeptidase [Pseudomonadales bacterium]
MRAASKIVLLFCSVLAISLAHAQNQVSIIYQAPVDKIETRIEQQLKASNEISDTLALINDTFRLEAPLQIIFGGKDGPLFDGDSQQILIPYTFVKEVESRFVTAKYEDSGRSTVAATMDAVMHTLFHELAHALIFMYELPIVGKEEDAADSLASILLIEFFNEGQEIAISTADLFNLESTDSETFEEGDFWDEHSLDVQRYYSTLCHIYGSNPEEYVHIAEDADFSEDRAELCIEEYNSLSHSWFTLLAPYTHDEKVSKK